MIRRRLFVKGCRKKSKAKNSVEEILAPLLVSVSDQTHQLARRMQSKWARTALQFETSFLGRAIAFVVVAGVAAGHEVLPRRSASARAWQHVIQRQLGGWKR